MRRVSLAILVYLIWEERNRWIFTNTAKSVEVIFRKFQILFYTILYFHEKNPLAYNVASWTALLVFLFWLGRAWFLQGFYVFAWMRWHVATVCGWWAVGWADGLQLLVGCFCLCMDELKSSTSLHGWASGLLLFWLIGCFCSWLGCLCLCMDELKIFTSLHGWVKGCFCFWLVVY